MVHLRSTRLPFNRTDVLSSAEYDHQELVIVCLLSRDASRGTILEGGSAALKSLSTSLMSAVSSLESSTVFSDELESVHDGIKMWSRL